MSGLKLSKRNTRSTEIQQVNQSRERAPGIRWATGVRWAILIVFGLLVVIAYVWFGDRISLQQLAEREQQLRGFRDSSPLAAYGLGFLIYVAITGLSLPGAAPMTLAYGWYYGLVPGVILVSFASTTGATIAFLFSRYLFRDAILSRFGDRFENLNRSLEAEGPFFLFSLRLIPVVPFFLVNALMGLTPIRVWTYWWVSQLGMLAGTIAYVYAGSVVPSLGDLAQDGLGAAFTKQRILQLSAALILLGVLPLAMRWLVKILRRESTAPGPDSVDSE